MTTAQSPLRELRAQADNIARFLKAIERGEDVAEDRGGKIAASREGKDTTFAVVMDDKILKITMSWQSIRETSEAGISQFILNEMREKRETLN